MATGSVKWFNTSRGYGFILPESGDRDIFVHVSALVDAGISRLEDGTKVNFELSKGPDGRESATNLEVVV